MLMCGCDTDEGTYSSSQKSYHQQGNTLHFHLILIIKRQLVYQLAPAMVQDVQTEEVSCYLQNNDSCPHVSEIFMTFWKFLELFLFWHFCDYRMDVIHLFCLQNVEIGILCMQACDISEKHTWSWGICQLKLESCFICTFLLAFYQLPQNSKMRHILDPYWNMSWTGWYKVIHSGLNPLRLKSSHWKMVLWFEIWSRSRFCSWRLSTDRAVACIVKAC